MEKTRFAYVSAILIIILMITGSQAAIQLTLWQEQVTRDTATLINIQELRTQRMLRSSLLLLAPNPMEKTINPLQVDPAKQLSSDLTFTQQSQTTLVHTSVSVAGQIAALQGDYDGMNQAGVQALTAYKKHDRVSLIKQVASLFDHEQKYLSGIYQAYGALTSQADDLVNRVRWLEISLYIISLVVVGFEVFGVVIPANKSKQAEIETYREQVRVLQSAMGAKRASANEGGTNAV